MFGWFKKEEPEQWRLVKECTPLDVRVSNRLTHKDEDGKVYIYLFESNKGNRCLTCKSTIQNTSQDSVNAYVKSSSLYMKRLYRWLMGRADPEINRYDEVEQEEVLHELRGSIFENLDDAIDDK